MNESNVSTSRPKYTKGEKCIFAHLVLTISLLIILVIIYLVHIGFVSHTNSVGVFDTRRSFVPVNTELSKFPIGLIYVNTTPIKNICNTLLLTPEWSVSAGHCVAMRSDPDLAYLLYTWRIKYPYDNNEGIKIKRGVVHPNFNRDTFANSVGLLEHMSVLEIQRYKIPQINIKNVYSKDVKYKNMAIISWDHEALETKGTINKIKIHEVHHLPDENCSFYVAPIIELRTYEFCIELKKKFNTILGHGALIIDHKNLTVHGTFTWGERQQKYLPLVILNLSHYNDWIKSVTSFFPLHG